MWTLIQMRSIAEKSNYLLTPVSATVSKGFHKGQNQFKGKLITDLFVLSIDINYLISQIHQSKICNVVIIRALSPFTSAILQNWLNTYNEVPHKIICSYNFENNFVQFLLIIVTVIERPTNWSETASTTRNIRERQILKYRRKRSKRSKTMCNTYVRNVWTWISWS